MFKDKLVDQGCKSQLNKNKHLHCFNCVQKKIENVNITLHDQKLLAECFSSWL